MSSRTKRNLPKGQDEKVVRAFGIVLKCDFGDRDHPRCRLVNIMPLPESDGREVHPVTHKRTTSKPRRRSPIKEEEPEVEQDLPENPDDTETLDETEEELVEDEDELDEDSAEDDSSDEDEDEEADEEDEDEE